MLDGIKSAEQELLKPKLDDKPFNWKGVCPVCGKESEMESFKELDFLISPCRYIYAKCGHRFLIGKGGV